MHSLSEIIVMNRETNGDKGTYRILTENTNRVGIEELISKFTDGCTIFYTVGTYNGTREKSLVIEVANILPSTVQELALEIKALNKQESVMVQSIPLDVVLL